jgi:hypothetical protein
MYGRDSINRGKGYYEWWVATYGEEKADEMEIELRRRKKESLKKYYETHKGTFTGKRHTAETKSKLSDIAKRRTKNGHSKSVYCMETNEVWETTRQLAAALIVSEVRLSRALIKGEYVQNERHYKRSNLSKA